ncbi:MAG: OmpA family protein [Cytophagaceae bacterium]
MRLFLLFPFFFILYAHGQDLKPTDKLALVTFYVTDFDMLPEKEAEIELINTVDQKIIKGLTDIEGVFKILLSEGDSYQLTVKKYQGEFDFGIMEIPVMPGALQFDQTLKIKVVTNYTRTFTLENVYFETNKFDLKKESFPALEGLLETLNFNPKMKIEIAGHTDSVGDQAANQLLSQRRADAIRQWLLSKGISPDRILSKGYGAAKPVADNATAEGRQLNRRTEVKIIEE